MLFRKHSQRGECSLQVSAPGMKRVEFWVGLGGCLWGEFVLPFVGVVSVELFVGE